MNDNFPVVLPRDLTYGMTRRQVRFCEEYTIDSNATQAAIRAGYSEKTARFTGSRLLTNNNVQTLVKHLFKQVLERNKATVDELIDILSNQVRFDIAELYEPNGSLKNIHDIPLKIRQSLEEITADELFIGSGEDRRVIGVTKKIKTVKRLDAVKLLMQYFGAFEKDNEQKRAQVVVFQIPDNNR